MVHKAVCVLDVVELGQGKNAGEETEQALSRELPGRDERLVQRQYEEHFAADFSQLLFILLPAILRTGST